MPRLGHSPARTKAGIVNTAPAATDSPIAPTVRAIFSSSSDPFQSRIAAIAITAGPERALALKLLGFGAVITGVGETAEPHRLCTYLFEVASLFTTFYEECPVLKASSAALVASRLALCALTLDVLTTGLGLLGVPVPERM